MGFDLSEEFAKRISEEDPLKSFRDRFYLNPSLIYMDGNSLGLMSKDSESSLLRVIDEWKSYAIDGWTNAETPWFFYAEHLAKLQAPLVGAEENEIIIHSSTTLNLHLLLATFYKAQGRRNKIMFDELNFPSDRYAIESQLRLMGEEDSTIVIQSNDGRIIEEDEIVSI